MFYSFNPKVYLNIATLKLSIISIPKIQIQVKSKKNKVLLLNKIIIISKQLL